MIDSLRSCGKTVNRLLLEDISAETEIKYRTYEKNDELLDSNDISMLHINLLQEEAKRSPLIDEISGNLQLEFKGLVAQQYTKIKHKIKFIYDNSHGETIKDIAK